MADRIKRRLLTNHTMKEQRPGRNTFLSGLQFPWEFQGCSHAGLTKGARWAA